LDFVAHSILSEPLLSSFLEKGFSRENLGGKNAKCNEKEGFSFIVHSTFKGTLYLELA
jgi:hypothetical protein